MTVHFAPLKYCPVNGNNPMTCTESGFRAACKSFRDMTVGRGKNIVCKHKYCEICGGEEIPEKVTFITLESATDSRAKQEMVMGIKKEFGTCWQCKEADRSLRTYVGKKTCATCGIIRGKAKSSPAILIAALEEFNNMPDSGIDGTDDTGDGVLASDLAKAKEKIKEMQEDLENFVHNKTARVEEFNNMPDSGIGDTGDGVLASDLAKANDTIQEKEEHIETIIRSKNEIIKNLKIRNELLIKENLSSETKIEKLNLMLSETSADAEKIMQELKDATVSTSILIDDDEPAGEVLIAAVPGYGSLTAVLSAALLQAAYGKGKERHAQEGISFDQQKICRITRDVGLGFPFGQAMKKVSESRRLGDRGPAEILGAIVYLGAAFLVMQEEINLSIGPSPSTAQEAVMETQQ